MSEPDLFDVTNMLLDRYAEAEGITSNYALAKALGCSQATIHNYRKRKTKIDPTTAVQIAERLRMDPLMVIAKVTMERGGNGRIHDVWSKYAGRLFLAALVTMMPFADQIRANPVEGHQTCYTLYARFCARFGAAARFRWRSGQPVRGFAIA